MSKNSRFTAESNLPIEFANRMQHGVIDYTYKGVLTQKCPMDMAIYMDIIWDLKPATVLEFGTNAGGSALWLADVLQNMGLSDSRLISVDINPNSVVQDDRIEFGHCDTNSILDTFSIAEAHAFAKPLLIIDDASHQYQQVLNVLNFFDKISVAGDYIIVEDGFISVVDAEDLFNYDGGPFQAIHKFLETHPTGYEIDRERCDFYGTNVTWNTDGYIRRVS